MTAIKKIEVFAEFQSTGLADAEGGSLCIDDLDLPEATWALLADWVHDYWTGCPEENAEWGSPTGRRHLAKVDRRGLELAKIIQAQVGAEYLVTYASAGNGIIES